MLSGAVLQCAYRDRNQAGRERPPRCARVGLAVIDGDSVAEDADFLGGASTLHSSVPPLPTARPPRVGGDFRCFWKQAARAERRDQRRCDTVYGMSWPTTDDPRTEFVTLRLTVSEDAVLNAYAKSKGMSRSAAVRDSVIRVINAEEKRAKKDKGASKT